MARNPGPDGGVEVVIPDPVEAIKDRHSPKSFNFPIVKKSTKHSKFKL